MRLKAKSPNKKPSSRNLEGFLSVGSIRESTQSKQAMNNLLIPAIIAHSLAIRIAFLFPVFRIAIAFLLVTETLLLIAFGGFSQTWDDRQKLYLILLFAGFIFAVLGGI